MVNYICPQLRTAQLEKITWNQSGQPTGEQGTVQLSNWVCEIFAEIRMLRFESAVRCVTAGEGLEQNPFNILFAQVYPSSLGGSPFIMNVSCFSSKLKFNTEKCLQEVIIRNIIIFN